MRLRSLVLALLLAGGLAAADKAPKAPKPTQRHVKVPKALKRSRSAARKTPRRASRKASKAPRAARHPSARKAVQHKALKVKKA